MEILETAEADRIRMVRTAAAQVETTRILQIRTMRQLRQIRLRTTVRREREDRRYYGSDRGRSGGYDAGSGSRSYGLQTEKRDEINCHEIE